MARAWGLETSRQVLQEWAKRYVDKATGENGLAVQFDGLEGWLLAQNPQSLEEAEHILSLLQDFTEGRGKDLSALTKAAGEHRRDGAPETRVSNSFAPRAYGPLGGRA